MKQLRKVFFLLAVLILLIAVAACHVNPGPSSTPVLPSENEKEPVITLPDCYEIGYEEYLKTEKDFWAFSNFKVEKKLPELDKTQWVGLAGSTYGTLVSNKEKTALYLTDRSEEFTKIADVEDEIIKAWGSDPVFYIAFSRSVWRGTFDGLWEKIYEIPEDQAYYTVSNIYPISTTDVRIDLLDHRVEQIKDWYGTGDGYTYKCGIYSTITNRMYDIPDVIEPNLAPYLTARFGDILDAGKDPYTLCCLDVSIYKKYGIGLDIPLDDVY